MKIGADSISDSVKLSEYLSGKCPFKGCQYSDDGICFNDDDTFLDAICDMINKIEDDSSIGKNTKCKPKVREGRCLYCNGTLKAHNDYVPYGDTNVRMTTYHCPNGC